ncbi:uncharacterized protein [Phyllobates terribilis]|uniref:uncharacterized protein n=1 Tax=Phyllobates terribilis TaxID=111132 RepID=UPI003CCAC17E
MMFFWKMLLLCSFAILSHHAVFARPAAKNKFAADLMSHPNPGKSLNHGAQSSWSKSGGSHSWTNDGTKEFHGKKSALSEPAWSVTSGGNYFSNNNNADGYDDLVGSLNTWRYFDPIGSWHRESDTTLRESGPFSAESSKAQKSNKKGNLGDLLGGSKHHGKHKNHEDSEHVAGGNYGGSFDGLVKGVSHNDDGLGETFAVPAQAIGQNGASSGVRRISGLQGRVIDNGQVGQLDGLLAEHGVLSDVLGGGVLGGVLGGDMLSGDLGGDGLVGGVLGGDGLVGGVLGGNGLVGGVLGGGVLGGVLGGDGLVGGVLGGDGLVGGVLGGNGLVGGVLGGNGLVGGVLGGDGLVGGVLGGDGLVGGVLGGDGLVGGVLGGNGLVGGVLGGSVAVSLVGMVW